MRVLEVRNAHTALPTAIIYLKQNGVVRPSRNGNVVRAKTPVTTVYWQPTERVEFHAWRDSNPFFHFYESLWMLAGRNDILPLTRYVKKMADFSDDGRTQNAAYGYRWRHARGPMLIGHDVEDRVDQLVSICDALKKNPNSRQEVLQIWDHACDLGTTTRDHACNIAATFQIFEDCLDIVVFCRSNDIIWGAYGSNAVHFSMLMEYVARRVGVRIGTYTQVSVNWHAYVDLFQSMMNDAEKWDGVDPYTEGQFLDPETPVTTYPIAMPGTDFAKWDEDCRRFVSLDGTLPVGVVNRADLLPFFAEVAWPIVRSHDIYKEGSVDEAISSIEECKASDWRIACRAWLKRRRDRSLWRETNEGVDK